MPVNIRLKDDLKGQLFNLEINVADGGLMKDLSVTMAGSCACPNAALAVQAALVLKKKGWNITESAIRKGIEHTVWRGRFEILRRSPYFIADGSHNEQGVRKLAESLKKYFPDRKIRFIVGVLGDKCYDKMMQYVIPLAAKFYTVTPNNPRALEGEVLRRRLERMGVDEVQAFMSPDDAIDRAFEESGADDVICSFGSLYYVGEVRRYVLREYSGDVFC
jgi:dihydrofolate synthase/folylpolyglutamate synthase